MSTFLQYNNHMILHPTDPSKYFYGIVEDPPEPPGPTFDEVTIGYQTWTSKNLSVDDGYGGIYTKTVNYGQGDVVEYYYTWEAAVRVAGAIDGWHLPSAAEWDTLNTTVGSSAGTKLKSTYGWSSGNGTDNYGFAVFPAGYRDSSSFSAFGSYGIFWTATEESTTLAKNRYFDSQASMVQYHDNKTKAFSVRLIKG